MRAPSLQPVEVREGRGEVRVRGRRVGRHSPTLQHRVEERLVLGANLWLDLDEAAAATVKAGRDIDPRVSRRDRAVVGQERLLVLHGVTPTGRRAGTSS